MWERNFPDLTNRYDQYLATLTSRRVDSNSRRSFPTHAFQFDQDGWYITRPRGGGACEVSEQPQGKAVVLYGVERRTVRQ